jgi:hypothetical protein
MAGETRYSTSLKKLPKKDLSVWYIVNTQGYDSTYSEASKIFIAFNPAQILIDSFCANLLNLSGLNCSQL